MDEVTNIFQSALQGTGYVSLQDRLPESYSLSGAIAEICDRVGMPIGSYDTARLLGRVDGMLVSSANPAFTYISTMAQAYMFDPANYDGVLHFIQRGHDPVTTVDEQDVLESVDEDDELQRKDSLAVPRVLHFQYMDLSGGLQPSMQHSDRSADNRSTGELSLQTPLILTTNDAQRIAIIAHKIAIEEQNGEYHFSLPDSYIELTNADVVIYRGNRLRIFEVLIEDGFQEYKAVFDRASNYQSEALGTELVESGEVVSTVPGDTKLEVMDIPIIYPDDDKLGIYVAVGAVSPAWRGARVELSLDGGQNYIYSENLTNGAVIGRLESAMPVHSRYWPNEEHNSEHSFLVRISTPYALLQGTDLKGMMNRQNMALIGDEIINFANADEVEPGLWRISHLLRGRRGTPILESPVGTRFVLLDRSSMRFATMETYDLGQQLTFRATTLGTSQSTTTVVPYIGVSQLERAPAYLRAIRSGNDLAISWQGVGRLGGRNLPRHSQHFIGYRVEVDGQTVDTQETSVNITVSAGTHTVKVYQRNAFTGNGTPAEVIV